MFTNPLRKKILGLYKQLLFIGKEYPMGYEYFRDKCKASFEKNRNLKDPADIKQAISQAEYVYKELEALWMLKAALYEFIETEIRHQVNEISFSTKEVLLPSEQENIVELTQGINQTLKHLTLDPSLESSIHSILSKDFDYLQLQRLAGLFELLLAAKNL